MADPLPTRALLLATRVPRRIITRAYWDLDVTGAENIPATGPVVVACNHVSHLDPPLVTQAVGRNVRYIAVDEIFGISRWFDRLIGFFGAIPTDRDGYPIGALRAAVSHLHAGGVMGVFPEGARARRWGDLLPPKRGAAWLAWMSGAPLVPMAIHGTDRTMTPDDRAFRRTAVRIWAGEPLLWHEYADRIDPLGAMMDDWASWVTARIEPWLRRGEGGS